VVAHTVLIAGAGLTAVEQAFVQTGQDRLISIMGASFCLPLAVLWAAMTWSIWRDNLIYKSVASESISRRRRAFMRASAIRRFWIRRF
jgi:hypothetical protein